MIYLKGTFSYVVFVFKYFQFFLKPELLMPSGRYFGRPQVGTSRLESLFSIKGKFPRLIFCRCLSFLLTFIKKVLMLSGKLHMWLT